MVEERESNISTIRDVCKGCKECMTGYKAAIGSEDIGNIEMTDEMKILREHWSPTAVMTDYLSTHCKYVGHSFSGKNFVVGCYEVIVVKRIYWTEGSVYEMFPLNYGELKKYREIKKINNFGMPTSFERPFRTDEEYDDVERKLYYRETDEIRVCHCDDRTKSYRYFCRAAKSINESWWEKFGFFCTAKPDETVPDSYASLFVRKGWGNHDRYVETWYQIEPTGRISELRLPFYPSDDIGSFKEIDHEV